MSFFDDPSTPGPPGSGAPVPDRDDPRSAVAASTPAPPTATALHERCDHCDAPVERSQRYCVVCGTSQRRADDPTARYLSEARRAQTVAAAGAAQAQAARAGGLSTTVAALLIALVPVAAGIGVVVGRGSTNSADQIVEALKAARGTGVAVSNVGSTPVSGAVTADAAAASTPDDKSTAKDDGPKVDGVQTSKKQAEILATGPAGSARKLEGSKPTTKDLKESKAAVDKINNSKGKAYIETQRDLPDTIVIP